MNLGAKRFLLAVAASACGALAGCSVPAAGPVAITKVNPYHLQSVQRVITEDEMISFEHRRLLRGAVEATEQRDRFGNYFTIFWKTNRREPVTVRLEYRQGRTGLQVHVQETLVEKPKRANTTKFQVTGEDYHTNGKVSQWRASIVENGEVVAEYKSYLWQ
jgi:outer membrane biogenesis lipoprotein LolB